MLTAVIPSLAYVALMAGFFAFRGRQGGFWWVAIPLIVGAGLGTALLLLRLAGSVWFTPVAIVTVLSPVVAAFCNRLTGYRWWPSIAVGQRALVTWLVLGGLLLSGTVGLFLVVILSR